MSRVPQTNVMPTAKAMLLEYSTWTPDTESLAAYQRVLGRFPLDEIERAIAELCNCPTQTTPPSARDIAQVVRSTRRRRMAQARPYVPCGRRRTPESKSWCAGGWLYEIDSEGYEVAAGACDCATGRVK